MSVIGHTPKTTSLLFTVGQLFSGKAFAARLRNIESEYFSCDTSKDIHSSGQTIAKTSL